jgi:REP element-mobilizing transposase RayT
MEKYKGKYRGQTFRLQSWNYASKAYYFVTIKTKNREHFFGEIREGQMFLSEIGKIVELEWLKTPNIRKDMNLELGEFAIMPDHFHVIIYIGENDYNSSFPFKNQNEFGPQSKNLAAVIRGFKSAVTTWCRKNDYPDFAWQSLFHEHIVRNQKSFERIEQYIKDNVSKWRM